MFEIEAFYVGDEKELRSYLPAGLHFSAPGRRLPSGAEDADLEQLVAKTRAIEKQCREPHTLRLVYTNTRNQIESIRRETQYLLNQANR